MAHPNTNTPERLLAMWSERYTVSERGCHEWSGARDRHGYGKVRWNRNSQLAHRVAYELFVGPIPEGLVVRHFVCGNTCCVNPAHLRLGTQGDNNRDTVRDGNWASGSEPLLSGTHWPIFLKRLNQLGLSHARLAKKFGVSKATITCTIQRAPRGKKENTRREYPGGQALPGPDWAIFLKRLNELGLSQSRLAKKFGVSRCAIRNTIKRAKNT